MKIRDPVGRDDVMITSIAYLKANLLGRAADVSRIDLDTNAEHLQAENEVFDIAMAGDEDFHEAGASDYDHDNVMQPMGGDASPSVLGFTRHTLPFAQPEDRELSSFSKRTAQISGGNPKVPMQTTSVSRKSSRPGR